MLRNFVFSMLSVALLLAGGLYSCQPNQNEPAPTKEGSEKAAHSTRIMASAPVVIGPYTVTFEGTSVDGLTWTYTIQRTGPAQGNGLSHWIIDLGACISFGDVVSTTIDGNLYTDISDSEGSGTGCQTSGYTFLKYDGLPDILSDGNPHTFSFTLAYAADPAQNQSWVKAGRNCYQGTVTGPGCFHVCGAITKEDVTITTTISTTVCATDPTSTTTSSTTSSSSSTGAYMGLEVVIAKDGVPNSTTALTTETDGSFCFTGLPKGTYVITPTVTTGQVSPNVVVSISPAASQSVTIPPSSDNTDFMVTTTTSTTVTNPPVEVSCIIICSFSQGYWFSKPDLVWPGPVSAGGNVYSQAEGKAIWNTSNSGGIPDAKKVFLQLAAIKLSAAAKGWTLSQYPQSVQDDVAIIDTYLAGLGQKITPQNYRSFAYSPTARAAADRISAWITANHCE